jgi:biopolymer transport protein ExbB
MGELIRANWLILTPIILLSVAALALIIERAAFFYRIRPLSGAVLGEALGMIGKQPVERILELFREEDSRPAKDLLSLALNTRMKSVPSLYRQRLESARDRHLDRMERNLPILQGIGNVSTLLGLFGTVSGMITAFSRMTETGNSDPYVLAGGISRALVTTAAGLAVAIPSLAALHVLEALTDRHADEMEEVVAECIAYNGASYARAKERKTAQA